MAWRDAEAAYRDAAARFLHHVEMQKRALEQQGDLNAMRDDYIRFAAATSSTATDQIASTKSLLDSGAITPDEFTALKAKALAG